MFKYLVFNDRNGTTVNMISRLFDDTRAPGYLDATQTDYTEFKKRRGKMIIHHGWNDPALSAFETIGLPELSKR
jgi:feruloyl esterase